MAFCSVQFLYYVLNVVVWGMDSYLNPDSACFCICDLKQLLTFHRFSVQYLPHRVLNLHSILLTLLLP